MHMKGALLNFYNGKGGKIQMGKMEKVKAFLSGKVIKIGLIILIIAGVAYGGYEVYSKIAKSKSSQNVAQETTTRVIRGDLEVKISGTGTVEPIERYDIVPLVKGTIISAPYEEGMQVKKGDVLYKIDDSDISFEIEKDRNNIEKTKLQNKETLENIKNLQIYAPCDGKITNFTLKVGDQVGNNSKVADIINDRQLKAMVSFTGSQIQQIHIGQQAQLTIPELMIQVDGKVTDINYTSKAGPNGTVLYDVEITIDNPDALTAGMQVHGVIKGNEGEIKSPIPAVLQNVQEETINAKTSGTVKAIYVKNDTLVKAGDKIMELENENLFITKTTNEMNLRDQQLSLESKLEQLKNYNITSPIDGVVIAKYYKAGDNLSSNNSSNILMTVADMSKMVFTIAVDELDIAKMQIGQKVDVTADALPGAQFEGKITNIPAEGTSQNGVTTYNVQVTIAEPGELRPGMNVNAEVIVQSKQNVLQLPIAAVTKVGNKYFVNVPETVSEDGKNDFPMKREQTGENTQRRMMNNQENKGDNSNQQRRTEFNAGENSPQRRTESNTGENLPQRRTESNAGENSPQNAMPPNMQAGSQRAPRGNNRNMPNVSGKKRPVEVEVGINNDEYIEIVSGLKEGDIVYVPTASRSNTNSNMPGFGMPGGGMPGGMRGGVPGGMPGGGMPGGGMRGGGMPGGSGRTQTGGNRQR